MQNVKKIIPIFEKIADLKSVQIKQNVQLMKNSFQYASKSKRLGNLIIDITSISVISIIIVLIIFGARKGIPGERIIFTIIFLAYYIFLEGFIGKTIGKHFSRTKVIYLKDKNKWFWIIVRSVLRLNPFDTLSYLFGVKYGVHDLLSFTRVIEIED